MLFEWVMQVSLLVLGFVALIQGAHWLVEGGTTLSKALGVSDLFIGLTVVALGTSLPEMFIDITAAVRGNTGLVIGDIIGSNVTNILLILGVTAVIYPMRIQHGLIWREIPFTFIAAVTVLVLGNDGIIDGIEYSRLGRIDGLVLIVFLSLYLYYLVSVSTSTSSPAQFPRTKTQMKQVVMLIAGGLIGLFVGSHLIVGAAVFFAGLMHVSETMIGLTIIALGSSLPELTASIVAAFRQRSDLALGNIVGSNIINIFLVLGVCAVIRPLPLRPQDNFAIVVALSASLLLFTSAFVGTRSIIDRWIGWVFILLYAFYVLVVLRLG